MSLIETGERVTLRVFIGLAVVLGIFLGYALFTPRPVNTLDSCRAANPGYNCVIGYVKGEAFK